MIPKKKNEENEYTVLIQEAIEKFFDKGYQDGDTVSMLWLHDTLKIEEPKTVQQAKAAQFELLTKLDMFKSELLEGHGIALRNIRGVGYIVVPPHDQTRYAMEECVRHINKGMKRADALLDNTRTRLLTISEKKRHTDAVVKFSAVKGIINRQKRDVFLMIREDA